MKTFRDCIVSYLDLNDVSEILTRNSARGVRVMRDLHRLVSDCAHKLAAHEEICFWQDSVLLLAPVKNTGASYQRVMTEVTILKETIHALHPCHAVSVKGQSFPAPSIQTSTSQPRIIYLSASSLAFSNCFEIERRLKWNKADWYIDPRIIRQIKSRKPDKTKAVTLLPRNISRKIHMFHGSFE
jgi:hypothetical protein